MIDKTENLIFLSHAWGKDCLDRDNHARCRELYIKMKESGYSLWFDEKNMKGNIDNSIIKGINNSKIILICLTKKYCDKINNAANNSLPNDNCYKEWSYSLFRQKIIIPIIMEPVMNEIYTQNDGIIQMYLNNTMFIDFSEEFDLNFSKLESTLKYYGVFAKSITPNSSNDSLSNYFLTALSPKKSSRGLLREQILSNKIEFERTDSKQTRRRFLNFKKLNLTFFKKSSRFIVKI